MKKISLLLAFISFLVLTACNSSEKIEVDIWENALYTENTEIEVEAEDKKVTLTVKTNAETLADALLENSLIEGEDGQYGIYIKVVNGIRADYDKDKRYWAMYKNGEYLMTGADATPIAHGEHYEFIYSK